MLRQYFAAKNLSLCCPPSAYSIENIKTLILYCLENDNLKTVSAEMSLCPLNGLCLFGP